MKKIKKSLNKIFSSIKKFLDKLIFIPISKVIYFVTSKYDQPGKFIEHWLSRTNTLLFISLAIAVTIFVVIDQKRLTYSESSAEVITSREVNVSFDEDNYVVEGIPESVDITLIGNKVDLYIAKQSPVNEVTIDLWGLTPGSHKVDIKYDKISEGIKYTVNPSVATVVIYEKESTSKTLSIDLLNQDSLGQQYTIESVTSKLDSVVIKGAAYKIEQVATVKALVDIKELVDKNSAPTFELNKPHIVSSTLKAYDKAGNIVDVEISPAKADVEILVSESSKEVPIVVTTKGKVIYNMGISNIAINDNKQTMVTLYGPEEVLSEIENIPVEINVQDLAKSTQFKVELAKPTGVKHMSAETAVIDITLSDDISNIDIAGNIITWKNLPDGYGVEFVAGAEVVDDYVVATVKAKGVTSIVEKVTTDDIVVYFDVSKLDLTGVTSKVFEVDIEVDGNDSRVEYQSSVLKIKVKLYKR